MTTFNLQLFGTNDTITSSAELKFQTAYTDGDTHLYSLKNPKSNLTSDAIVTASNYMTETQIFLSDKSSASTTGIVYAYTEEKTITNLDLS